MCLHGCSRNFELEFCASDVFPTLSFCAEHGLHMVCMVLLLPKLVSTARE